MKILIGYDGSPFANAAIEDLKRAGLPASGEAVVLAAADVFLPTGPDMRIPEPYRASLKQTRESARAQVQQAQELAKRAQSKVKALLPGWSVKHQSCADSPAWALVKKAEEWKPDFVVVGAHGHAKLGRFLGSVSQMVLTQSPCSVRVARSGSNPNTKLRILIGVDGSPDSAATVEAVARRSWARQTEFVLLSVIDPKRSTFVERLAPAVIKWFIAQADTESDAVGHMLESYSKPLRDVGARVTCEVKRGDPKRVIIQKAEAWGADSIFVGARGLTHLKRLFVGGVSTAIAARAHCSVEVIRTAS